MASEATYQKYRRAARYPLFLAGLGFTVGFMLALDPHPPTDVEHAHLAARLTLVSWAVFLIDYLVSLALAPDKRDYMKTHLLQGIGVLFPPLRILLIFHVTYVAVRGTRRRFGAAVRTYLLYASTLIILVSSMAALLVERDAPGATIVSFGDSLWWAAETISTVGYGDMYPVTVPGRMIAVTLMVNGFVILSVLTATVAEKFVQTEFGVDPNQEDEQPASEPEV